MRHLTDVVERLAAPRVALVGDFLLDRYVYGDVERINPEAPVPVLRVVRTESRVGGTGNVAAAVAALGAAVRCFGAIGADAAGEELVELLSAAGADPEPLLRLPQRPTPVKTRYVGLAQHRSAQQMLRVDEEDRPPVPAAAREALRQAVRPALEQADILVVEDYDKGLLDERVTPAIIDDARRAGRAVVVDPAIIADYRRYVGATVIKPNRYEAALASGIEITDDASLSSAARRLLEITGAEAAVITLDREGAYLEVRGQGGGRVPHQRPRAVSEVSGAGDETLAVLSVAVAAGCGYRQAVELANIAGGLEVERFGFVPITREELVGEIRRSVGLRGGKLLPRQQLAAEWARRRAAGATMVFTNGCFDLLHMGHVRYLQQARRLGTCLTVAINSDASARRLKGPRRPVIGQQERAEMLAALECVDYVTIFEEDTPEPLLELLKPDVLAKGGSTGAIVGQAYVQGYGGKVVKLDLVEGLSTTSIIERILSNHDGA